MKMAVVQKALQGYNYVFDELCDPRTKDWWLLSGPGPLMTILVTYIYFCVKAGPQYMKHKKPYDLKNVVMVYNIVQILLSVYMAYMVYAIETITSYPHPQNLCCDKASVKEKRPIAILLTLAKGVVFIFTQGYELQKCHSVDYTSSPNALQWTTNVWLFFVAKITELLDTVFFVLRKKDKQITFLHLYHHATMPIIGWIGAKYAPGGQAVPEGSINAFIHVIMYSYYFISSLGPQYQKYLWWKKYVTSIQLVQFCIIVYMNTNCLMSSNTNYPKFLSVLVLINCVSFFYMFGKFYYNSYVKSKKDRSE